MGVYAFELDIPSNTTSDAPVYQTLSVNKGIIKEIELYYPLNNIRLGNVWFHADGKQILPTNIKGNFTGNGNIQIIKPNTEIFDTSLSMVGFNLDTIFDHKITAVVTIEEPKTVNGIDYGLASF